MSDRIIASVSPEWRDPARRLLTEALPGARLQAVGEDLVAVSDDGLAIGDVAATAPGNPFLRHLFRETSRLEVPPRQTLEETLDAIADAWVALPVPLPPVAALQVWASGPVAVAFRPDTLRREVETMLRDEGIEVARSGAPQVLSVCLAGTQLLLGLNGTASALSDWPGGRVRLAKPKGQISRSEFKLEELFRTTDLRPPDHGMALDLGASPGGWTRILRTFGPEVVAVDPADLDPRIADDPGIHHVRNTAAPFLRETRDTYTTIVNDMRMEPAMSAGLMADAARNLEPGGLMVVTLKLGRGDPIVSIRGAVARLERVVDVKLVRQLHHNRGEVTVVGIGRYR